MAGVSVATQRIRPQPGAQRVASVSVSNSQAAVPRRSVQCVAPTSHMRTYPRGGCTGNIAITALALPSQPVRGVTSGM